jgi:hypothetical protein
MTGEAARDDELEPGLKEKAVGLQECCSGYQPTLICIYRGRFHLAAL